MIAENGRRYDTEEVCELLNYTIGHLYKLIRAKKIRTMKIGKRHSIKGEWINDFIEESNK